jgi:predicted RND superfamily exporter protein
VLARPVLEHIPADPPAFDALLGRLDGSTLIRGLFLSADGEAAAFYVRLAGGTDRDRFVDTLERWAVENENSEFELRLAGPVIVEVTFGRKILEELGRLVPLMLLLIAALLYGCLRSAAMVLVVLVQAGLVLVWTLGAMGLCRVPITLVTTVLPVVLVAMAVTDDIHLLERFRRRCLARAERAPWVGSRMELRFAMKAALLELARPIAVTSLTTAVGFLSFLSSSLSPLRHFGAFTALGIAMAMAFTFILVPALVLVLPARWLLPKSLAGSSCPGAGLRRHERFVVRRESASFALGCLLVLVLAPGMARLSVQDSWIDNLDPASGLVLAERAFNAHFWGSYRFDVVLTSGRRLFFHEPAGLRLLEAVSDAAARAPHVGGVVSPLTAFETAARAEGHLGPVSGVPPETLVEHAQLLHRVSPRLDFDHLLRFDGASARIRLFVKDADYVRTQELAAHLQHEIPPLLAGQAVGFHFSGDLPATQAAVGAIVGNMLRSVGWAILGVAGLLALSFGSLGTGARTTVPVLAGISMVLGGMGYAGVPLGVATSMFVALTVGVGVDFAIHYGHVYRSGRARGLAHSEALTAAIASTGRAVGWNTTVLALGFLVLALSGLEPNRNLGILLSASLLASYGATLLLSPRLLRYGRVPARPAVNPSRIRHKTVTHRL